MTSAMIVVREEAQKIRNLLEKFGFWDSQRRLRTISPKHVAIPVKVDTLVWEDIGLIDRCQPCQIEHIDLPASKTAKLETPLTCLKREVCQILKDAGRVASPELLADLPSRWEKHGDLILVSESAFTSDIWSLLGESLWKAVCRCLGGCRVARKSSVSTDGFRSPRVTLLYGNDGWVDHVDNGIRYSYDVTRCMFSIGNITEKLRVAQLDCQGETVLDLYAGIGYFTLPYLVHAKAERVIACEWNPNAVEALTRNLHLNNVQDRCTVHQGDNRQVCPRNEADRVNLGLIPSSEPGWSVACAALKSDSGGILHIHGNVTSKPSAKCNSLSSSDKTHDCVGKVQTLPQVEPESKEERFQTSTLMNELENRHVTGTCEGVDGKVSENAQRMDVVEGPVPCVDGAVSQSTYTCPSAQSSVLSEHPVTNNDVSQTRTGADLNSDFRNSEVIVHNVNSPEQSGHEQGSTGENQVEVSCNQKMKPAWFEWGKEVSVRICDLLESHHQGAWVVKILHIEHVKSYAPHIDHMVLDLECRPCTK